MGTTTPTMYHGMYLGTMSPDQANLLLNIRQATGNEDGFKGLEGYIFNFPYELIRKSIENQKAIRQIVRDENIDYTKYVGKLRPYQRVGTSFMYYSPRSIIADGVGLGKTAEIAALLNILRMKKEMNRFIMAVENSAFNQTTMELIKFTGMNVIPLESEAAKLKREIDHVDWRTVDGIVIKHSALRSDTLSKWIAMNLNEDGTCKLFDTFILDESSVIKNAKTKTYEYTMNICNICKRVHFMNATTFETNIMDIYYQVDMMNPVLLPKKWRIEKEFCAFC